MSAFSKYACISFKQIFECNTQLIWQTLQTWITSQITECTVGYSVYFPFYLCILKYLFKICFFIYLWKIL